MLNTRPLQRLLFAAILSATSGFASAGLRVQPQDNNDDTDIIVALALGMLIASSIDCASEAPLLPLCDEDGNLKVFTISE